MIKYRIRYFAFFCFIHLVFLFINNFSHAGLPTVKICQAMLLAAASCIPSLGCSYKNIRIDSDGIDSAKFGSVLSEEQKLSFLVERGAPLVLQVGSPYYIGLRSYLRMVESTGVRLSPREMAFINLEKTGPLLPGTLLVFTSEFGEHKISKAVLNDPTNSKPLFYLYSQATGLFEVLDEGIKGVEVAVIEATLGTVRDTINAFQADQTFAERMKDSGLALVDSSTGILISAADIFVELSYADFTRAIKAGVRVPFNVIGFGETVVRKTLRLPIDLILSIIHGFDDKTDLIQAPWAELNAKMINNSSYAGTFEIPGSSAVDTQKFDSALVLKRQGLGYLIAQGLEPIFLKWKVIQLNSESNPTDLIYFLFTTQNRIYLARGVISGKFDVKVDGQIIEVGASNKHLKELIEGFDIFDSPKFEYFFRFAESLEQPFGRFGFDD